MSERAQAIISIEALHHNFDQIKNYAPRSHVLAMIKSNAYGHGSMAIAKALNHVNGLGVACIKEAIILREGGITTAIVLMSGIYSHADLDLAIKYNLQMVVHDPFQVKLLESARIQKHIAVWVKVDTGMHRLGFPLEKFKTVYELLANHNNIIRPIPILTHLADADDLEKPMTLEQVEKFQAITKDMLVPKSIANSAGIIAWPDTISDWVRPGIMLYGISPILNKTGKDHNLRPVMTLKSKIIALHDYKRHDPIGYGGIWKCPEDMRIGVAAIGYGDGYPRHAQNGTPVLVNGKSCSLVGRVSMDMITIDLRNCKEARVGDDVILWGNGLPAEVVAKCADTIAYEILCNVSQRVDFVYC